MIQPPLDPAKDAALVAELAAATFRVAERHDFQSAFIDIELDLWHARSARIEQAVAEEVELAGRSDSGWPLQSWAS